MLSDRILPMDVGSTHGRLCRSLRNRRICRQRLSYVFPLDKELARENNAVQNICSDAVLSGMPTERPLQVFVLADL